MGVDVFFEWPWPKVVASLWALLAAPFLLVWFFYLRNNKQKKYRLPPGPPKYPFIGNMNVLMDTSKPTHHVVDDLAKTYGPLLLLKVGVQNLVFVSDPEMTMEFLKAQDHLFAYRPDGLLAGRYWFTARATSPLTSSYGVLCVVILQCPPALGQPGEYHNFLLRFVVSELLSNKKLQEFRGIRMGEQKSIISEAYLAAQRKESVDVRGLFNTLTLNVITRMGFGKRFFGLDVNEHDEKLKSHQAWVTIIPEMTTRFGQMLAESVHPSLYWIDTLTGVRKEMQSCHKRLDALCQDLVDEHKHRLDALSPQELEEYEPKDFMDIMLLLRGKENGQHITDRNLKAVSMDLIVAGTDTSATTLEWSMSELLKAPELMKRAQEEVDKVVGFDRTVNESDIPNMPFLAAVVKETFRLHPPLPWLLPHSNRVDQKVGGYDIPKGSFINFNVYGMSRDPAYWPDPLKFDPDRFYNIVANEVEMKGTHPQLLPFGTGRRICPGIHMTMATVHSTLARMLHSFDWKVAAKDGATEIDMSERSGPVAAKLISLEAFGTPRLPAHLY
ncbi:unnamed protein product [Calypogeia fissa]